jgi:cytochrome c oxidase subunit II
MIERLIPPAASAHAPSLDAVLYSVHAHMLMIFVLWLAVFVYALVRFRRGAHPEPRLEGVRAKWPALAIGLVIAGDVVILAALALPAWSERNQPPPPIDAAQDKPGARPLEVRIAAEQFAWNIHYPGPDGVFGRTDPSLINATNPIGIDRADPAAQDDIGLLNVLTLPVDRTVVVQLTSRDVVHSFTLNEMRVKQDANPGMVSRLWFRPITTGNWEIACSQLCGLGHYRMRGEYRVVTPEEWAKWEADEVARIQ